MLAALEKHAGPPVTIRGRVVTFKFYLNTWHFDLQPGYATWDRPSNAQGWVRFERLRLVLADKVKVDQIRAAQTSGVPPPSPPPPSPPPSPPHPPVVGDESDDDSGGAGARARAPARGATPTAPVIGDESDDDVAPAGAQAARPAARRSTSPGVGDDGVDDEQQHNGGANVQAGHKRMRSPARGTVHAAIGDEDDDDGDAGGSAPSRAPVTTSRSCEAGKSDDELGSDDDDVADEEVSALLDSRTFAHAPCVRALFTRAVHRRDTFKLELQLGLLSESSRVHLFREGRCELDFVDQAAYDEKLRRMGML